MMQIYKKMRHLPIQKETARVVRQSLEWNVISDYSSLRRISTILIADAGMRLPGPKIAATPAL